MNRIKDLSNKELEVWFDVKFRDGLLIKFPRDIKAHAQILNKIKNNGNGGLDVSSPSIIKRLDKIQAVVENNHKYDPIDTDTLREELKFYMAEKDLTIHDVARLIEKDSKTAWQFLKGIVKSQDRTIYKIKKLVENHLTEKIEG